MLLWAVKNRHREIVSLLSTGTADLNLVGNEVLALLSWAAENGHNVVVKVLLEMGADRAA